MSLSTLSKEVIMYEIFPYWTLQDLCEVYSATSDPSRSSVNPDTVEDYVKNAYGAEEPVLDFLSLVCKDPRKAFLNSVRHEKINRVRFMLDHLASEDVPKISDEEDGRSEKQELMNTALGIASESSSIDIVRLLLEESAEPDDEYGENLVVAANSGDEDVVRLLIEYGATLEAGENQALIVAAENGDANIIRTLLENNKSQEYISEALFKAIDYGQPDAVQALLENRTEIDEDDYDYFIIAIGYGELEMVRAFLEHGLDVNARGGKPLQCASKRGHVEIVQLLLQYISADSRRLAISEKARNLAAENGHKEVLNLLRSYD